MFSPSTFSLANIVFFLDNTKYTPFFSFFFTFAVSQAHLGEVKG